MSTAADQTQAETQVAAASITSPSGQPQTPSPSLPCRSSFRRVSSVTPTPIRGDFIQLASPVGMTSSAHRLDDSKTRGVTLHLSLTDSQMERLTEAISRPGSPERGAKGGRCGLTDRESALRPHINLRPHGEDELQAVASETAVLPTRQGPSLPQPDRGRKTSYVHSRHGKGPTGPRAGASPSVAGQFARTRDRSSAAQRDRLHVDPDRPPTRLARPIDRNALPTLAQRRGGPRPLVDIATAQRQVSPCHGKPPIEILRPNEVMHAQSPVARPRLGTGHGRGFSAPSPSVYSAVVDSDDGEYETIAPLSAQCTLHEAVRKPEPAAGVLRSLAEFEDLYRKSFQPQQAPPRDDPRLGEDLGAQVDTRLYTHSPLTPYIETMEDKVPRRKVLIGEHGWLEQTGKAGEGGGGRVPQQQAETRQKKVGILQSLKKVAKDVVERADIKATAAAAAAGRLGPRAYDGSSSGVASGKRRPNRLDISLDPREQSLFYCELEFLVTTALDGYLTSQFNSGRLQADKLSKVAGSWRQKGRPRVVGFRYDLETQLELMLLHLDDFKFYGMECSSPAAVTGVLEMMKADARAMRVRTFCQPDLVMAKQLLDSQKLFNILGCPDRLQVQLHEVVYFFKLVLARQRRSIDA